MKKTIIEKVLRELSVLALIQSSLVLALIQKAIERNHQEPKK